jgi:uncharacterized membrane-anchored protein
LIGKQGYDGIDYGIENYFIPEGTGPELARKAKVAVVRVGSNGNAMLVALAEK